MLCAACGARLRFNELIKLQEQKDALFAAGLKL